MANTETTTISISTEGRRHYIIGAPYAARETLKTGGAKWDPDRRAWWSGSRDVAESLLTQIQSPTEAVTADATTTAKTYVAGRATYKGRTYYVAGRVVRGRTQWDDDVAPVTTRDGGRTQLLSQDGRLQFWADSALVTVTRSYQRPQTLQGLRRYAEDARQGITHSGGRHCQSCGHDGDMCADMDCVCRACGGMLR